MSAGSTIENSRDSENMMSFDYPMYDCPSSEALSIGLPPLFYLLTLNPTKPPVLPPPTGALGKPPNE